MLRIKKNFLILELLSINIIKTLENLNIPFNANIKEKYISTVKIFTYFKAIKATVPYKENFILVVDKIVNLRKKILDKTFNKNNTIKIFKNLSGRRHNVFIGLTLIAENYKAHYSSSRIMIFFKNLEEKEILKYISKVEWRGCTGCHAIQGYAQAFIKYSMNPHKILSAHLCIKLIT